MRHRKKDVKLGRSPSHHKVTVGSLVCHLIEQKRIRTTLPKARLARSLAEKMVTLGRHGTLPARKQAIARLRNPLAVSALFTDIVPKFEGRNGGYTRIMKLGPRRGDGAEMAVLEWVGIEVPDKRKKKPVAEEKDKTEKAD
jgi:large subunit ribosomal protein L17